MSCEITLDLEDEDDQHDMNRRMKEMYKDVYPDRMTLEFYFMPDRQESLS